MTPTLTERERAILQAMTTLEDRRGRAARYAEISAEVASATGQSLAKSTLHYCLTRLWAWGHVARVGIKGSKLRYRTNRPCPVIPPYAEGPLGAVTCRAEPGRLVWDYESDE